MIFGESVQRARQCYNCCHCGDWIYPGEVYHRQLLKMGPRSIFVMQTHYERPCPPQPWEDEDADEGYANDNEEAFEELPIAA